MRHLPLIVTALVTFSFTPLAAQSAIETERWLNARLAQERFHPTYVSTITEERFSSFFGYVERGGRAAGTEEGSIRWRDITGIVAERRDRSIRIVITGRSETREFENGEMVRTEPADLISVWLKPDADGEAVARALRHLATLRGARLVDENLFG